MCLHPRQGTFASKVDFSSPDSQTVKVTREVDGGLETLEFDLPMVITCDLRLNDPRFASLTNIMKARKKKVETIDVASLGIDISPRVEVLHVTEPPKRPTGIVVDSIDDLVDKLRNERNVL